MIVTRGSLSPCTEQILPETVKRRRNFAQRTVYNIGAGLVGVALIALLAASEKTRADTADLAHRNISRQKTRYTQTHTVAEEQAKQNLESKKLIDYLAARAVPLNGLVLTMRALQECKPPEIWIRSLEVREQNVDAGGGKIESKPVVVLEGSGSAPRTAEHF